MNNIFANTSNHTPIEIALGVNDEGMTTARKLYEFLELRKGDFARWCKTNITENTFATEGEDYVRLCIDAETPTGGKIQREDYRLTAHFAKKLSMKGNGEKAEQAREYFTRLEESVKQRAIDRSQLSPEIQALYGLLDNQAKLELEQRRQQEEISRIDTTVSTMKEIFTQPIGDWKAEINARVREVAHKSGIEYQELYNRMYGELETTAHCSLKRLQENKKARMEKAGNTKTAIKEGTTKIAIIFEKPQLKAIFETIVRQYAMRYCA